ncbi:MAG: tetratricopeptide repeat protein, partial [Planctomycetes bacterium]|nr:tetratricopeptide repeat protein [Planctomycetota bacterium]
MHKRLSLIPVLWGLFFAFAVYGAEEPRPALLPGSGSETFLDPIGVESHRPETVNRGWVRDYNPDRESRLLRDRAYVFLKNGDFAKAQWDFSRALRLCDSDINAWYGLGLSLWHVGEYKFASRAFYKSYSLSGNLQMLYDTAYACFRDGDVKRACELVNALLKRDVENGPGWKLMGLCYETLMQQPEAKTCFLRALDFMPEDQVLAYHLEGLGGVDDLGESFMSGYGISPSRLKMRDGKRETPVASRGKFSMMEEALTQKTFPRPQVLEINTSKGS